MNVRWNSSEYGGVRDLRIPPHRLWKPDVLMYNSADEGFDGTYPTNVVVRNNGSCLYVPPGIFKSTCKIDITWFPFDDQRCEMKFGSWTYDGFQVGCLLAVSAVLQNRGGQADQTRSNFTCCLPSCDVRLRASRAANNGPDRLSFQLDLQLQDESGGDISSFITNGEWELLGVPGKRNEIYYNCCPEPYIDITFAILIRRKTLYYFFNLIVPCVLIASMALLGFTLPPDSGEKLSLVFLNMVAETMPATSDAVPLLGTYFNCIMFMVASSVVSTILILNYHHRNSDTHEMSEWIRVVFLIWLPFILRMSRPGEPYPHPCRPTVDEKNKQLQEVEMRERSSKSLLANVLDIDDDFRCNHRCNTLPHNPTYYRTVYRQGEDGSVGPIGATDTIGRSAGLGTISAGGGRLHETVSSHTCLSSSAEYELALILKELRYITDQLRKEDESGEITREWKFAAMVVDRLCLIIFTLFTIIATLAVLSPFPSPSLPAPGAPTGTDEAATPPPPPLLLLLLLFALLGAVVLVAAGCWWLLLCKRRTLAYRLAQLVVVADYRVRRYVHVFVKNLKLMSDA
uniref:Neurotransmitter-gated ion-channel ligand-binding domain-containing protein n=1 Tax=Anopheles dirus TaxID=7168 RepID=A0A182MZV9_9DIPT